MKFFLYLAFLCLLPSSLMSQKETRWKDGSTYELVYKLGLEDASKIIQANTIDIDQFKLQERIPFDTVPLGMKGEYLNQAGFYLRVKTKKHQLVAQLELVQQYEIKKIPNRKQLTFIVLKNGSALVRPEKLTLNGKTIAFDEELQAYRTKTGNGHGVIVISSQGEQAIFPIYKSYNRFFQRFGNKVLYSFPVKLVYKPGRDLYQSITYGEPIGIVKRVGSLIFRDLRNNRVYGYLLLNKPKYQSGDTIRYKVKLAKQNGRAYSRKVTVNIPLRGGKNYQYETPLKKGQADGEIVLHDSLNLALDAYQHVSIKRGNQALVYTYFDYEEYVLKSETFDLQLNKQKHSNGEENKIILSGKDENDNNLKNSRYELKVLVKSVQKNRLMPQQFIPHLLFETKGRIDATGDTEIILPDSIFPKADLEYEVKVAFKNAANDRIEKTQEASFLYNKPQISMEINNDSIVFAFPESYTGNLNLKITGFSTLGALVVAKTKKQVVKLKLNPSFSAYWVYDQKDNLLEVFYMTRQNSGISYDYTRAADSLKISLKNTANIPLWYTLYREKRVIEEGFTETGIDLAIKAKNKESYLMHYRYLWSGDVNAEEFEMDLYDQLLNISVDQQNLIIPGITDTIKVTVTDYKNRPVANADIAVASITSKFKQDNIPDVPYFGWSGNLTVNHKSFQQPYGYDLKFQNKLKNDKWQKGLGLDTMLYYQITQPKDLDILYLETPDNQTQFAAFAMRLGNIESIYYIKLDGQLVYAYTSDVEVPFSFKAKEGFHSIQIRTYSELIEVDSIYFEKGEKTVISIAKNAVDPRIYRKELNTEKYNNRLSAKEKDLIAKHTFRLQMSYAKNLTVRQGATDFSINQNYRHEINVAPVVEDSISIITEDKIYHLLFDPGYIYQVTDQQVFKKELTGSSMNFRHTADLGLFDFLALKGAETGLNAHLDYGIIITDELDLKNLNLSETQGILSIYPPEDKKELLKAAYIRPLRSDTLFTKLNRFFTAELDSGTYQLVILYTDSTFIEEEVVVKAQGLNIAAPTLSSLKSISLFKGNSLDTDVPVRETISPLVLKIPTAKPNLTGFISGRVIDGDDSLPLPQVSIYFKGTTVGMPTGPDGRFLLPITNSSAVLVVRFLGYVPQEIEIGNNTEIEIQLAMDVTSLEEVIVTAQGVSRNVSNNSEPSNLNSLLMGKVAGVQVTGAYGYREDYLSMTIRGQSSTSALNSPLIVVDGVIVGSMDNIDADSILETSVLKKSAATAIYGVRGANGVLLITTKNGPAKQSQRNTTADYNQPASASSIRNNFRDYGFWIPTAKTNKKGEVTLVVSYPDDITSWQNHFLAMTQNGKTGQLETTTKAFKPISARLSIPRFLIKGDTSSIYGEISNFTGDSSIVDRTFMIDEEVFNLGSKPVIQGHVDSLNIFATDADSLEISYLFEAKSGNDGERRNLQVLAKGMQQTIGAFHILENDTTLLLKPLENHGKPTLTILSDMRGLLLQDIRELQEYRYWCNEQKASKLMALLAEKQLLDKTDQKFKKNSEIMRLITRIRKSKASSGGWGWWENMRPSTWVSNHVTRAMLLAQFSGYNTKTDLKESTRYLTEQLPLLRSTELIETMHVLLDVDSSLSLNMYLPVIEDDKNLSNTDKVQFMYLKHRLGEAFKIDSLMAFRRASVKDGIFFEGSEQDFRSGNIITTIAAYRLLKSLGGYENDLTEMREYLMLSRSNGVKRNTYETAHIINTIGSDLSRAYFSVNISLNGQKIDAFPYQVTLEDSSPITITQNAETLSYLSLSQDFWNDEPLTSANLGQIQTTFINDKGEEIDSLEKGKFVKLKLRINITEELSFAMLEVPIPAGTLYSDKPQAFNLNQYREYFKDKVSFYFESLSPGIHEFEIPLVSQFAGNFNLNPAQLSLMYRPLLSSNNESRRVVIR
ncbi:MAG: TonB-dependent SusC/RagA subfamily outer membrane receptor [Candidatus Endobugula sp.]|jgi:TonB-dependent SusC/RagA subfamily outer membrane receptor